VDKTATLDDQQRQLELEAQAKVLRMEKELAAAKAALSKAKK
jgi:hypothetical protein